MKLGGISNMIDDRINILIGWVIVLKLIRRIMVKFYFLDKKKLIVIV